jgi:hypothetical protein
MSEPRERIIVTVRRCAAAERSLVHRPSSLSFDHTAMVHRPSSLSFDHTAMVHR